MVSGKKNFYIGALLLCCMLLPGLAGCALLDKAADNPASDKPRLVIGLDDAYPPYGFRDDAGQIVGFDVDLAREVAQRNGWELVTEPIDWDAKDQLLNSGSIDCIWNGFTKEGREGKYAFSEPYMLNKQVVVVRANSGIQSLAGLAGKTVETQVDSSALHVLQDNQAGLADTFAKLDEIAEYNTAFMDLESGAVDAVACDLSVAEYQMAAKPGIFTMLEPALSEEHYAIAFKLGDDARVRQVNETLREMYKDGTVARIAQAYEQYGLSMNNWLIN